MENRGLEHVDFILSDYRLRKGRIGLGEVQLIRSKLGEVPATIWSGDTAPGVLRKVAASGLTLMSKPVKPAAIREALAAAWAQKQTQPAN
jgi:hypothetical protein